MWALNNPIPQFLTCLGLGWGGSGGGGGGEGGCGGGVGVVSSSNVPVVNLKLSHQIPSVGSPATAAFGWRRGGEASRGACSSSAYRSGGTQVVNSAACALFF